MKILHLAYRDTSGVPGRWAAAHREAGAEARLLVELPHPFAYEAPATVERWSPGTSSAQERADRIGEHLGWADAIMAYDHPFYLDAAVASGKPVLFRALGQSSREYHDEISCLLASAAVVRATTGTPDLAALLDIELAGAPYPLPAAALGTERLTLCHCPSDRDAKGTDRVLAAAAAEGWHVTLVEGLPNSYVIDRKRRCAAVVDACGPGTVPDGYGVNAVEAMALGLPVVASASPEATTMLIDVGSPAVLVGDEAGLRAALRALKDPGLRADLGEAGRAFVAEFHSPAARATEDLQALEALVAA